MERRRTEEAINRTIKSGIDGTVADGRANVEGFGSSSKNWKRTTTSAKRSNPLGKRLF
jgi:hypothetical protein